jgi:ribonuclease HI
VAASHAEVSAALL